MLGLLRETGNMIAHAPQRDRRQDVTLPSRCFVEFKRPHQWQRNGRDMRTVCGTSEAGTPTQAELALTFKIYSFARNLVVKSIKRRQ